MMITVILVSLLIGIMLGQRFKVLVLLPAISLALICTIGAGIAWKESWWSIFWWAVAATIALQLGYLGGTCIRARREARAARLPAAGAPAAPAASPTQRSPH